MGMCQPSFVSHMKKPFSIHAFVLRAPACLGDSSLEKQRSEIRGQRSEGRGRWGKAEIGKAESRNGRKVRGQRTEGRAFTRLELLALVSAVFLLLLVSAPLGANVRTRTDRLVCEANLRQIGHAYQIWASDHG